MLNRGNALSWGLRIGIVGILLFGVFLGHRRGAVQDTNASQADSFKERRRLYMRERYRPQQRELESRAIELAKQDREKPKRIN